LGKLMDTFFLNIFKKAGIFPLSFNMLS